MLVAAPALFAAAPRAPRAPRASAHAPFRSPAPRCASSRPGVRCSAFEGIGRLSSFLERAMGGAESIGEDPSRERWWNEGSLAIVTGANKGIGLEIVRGLASQGVPTVLTARSEELGSAACDKLNKELPPGAPKVTFRQCDITSAASVSALAQWLGEAHGGKVDILVNNAGIAFKGSTFGAEEAQTTIDTNVTGTIRMCEALVPLLPEGAGRIVNVCSMAGGLGIIKSPGLRARWENAASKDDVEALCSEFVEAIRSGSLLEAGWPSSMYGVSKLGEATYTRVLAAELAPRGAIVSAVCPGYCATDMSSWRGTNTAASGADTPVAARLPFGAVLDREGGQGVLEGRVPRVPPTARIH